jgi:F-type H+-transporting ATPase subunit b
VQDVERMKAAASQEMDGERERAIATLRAVAVAMALERSEARLKEQLDHSAQEQLIDRSLALL